MFYPAATIFELMPDVLVLNEAPSMRGNFGNFKKQRLAQNTAIAEQADAKQTKQLQSNAVWRSMRSSYRSLPESVLCHPSIGYAFRYGNVVLNGLDNDMEK